MLESYQSMRKKGAIILATGGDQSNYQNTAAVHTNLDWAFAVKSINVRVLWRRVWRPGRQMRFRPMLWRSDTPVLRSRRTRATRPNEHESHVSSTPAMIRSKSTVSCEAYTSDIKF